MLGWRGHSTCKRAPHLCCVTHGGVKYGSVFLHSGFVRLAMWCMIVGGLFDGLATVGSGTGTSGSWDAHVSGSLARTWDAGGRECSRVAMFKDSWQSRWGIRRIAPMWCISAIGVVRNVPSSHLRPAACARSRGQMRLFCLMPVNQTGDAKVRVGSITVLYSSLVFVIDSPRIEFASIRRPARVE